MNQQPNILSPKEAFKACFSAVAGYLGRPSAETVLFAGVPLSETRIEVEDIRHLAERIGLEVQEFSHRDFLRGRVDLPAILFRVSQLPVALLAEMQDGAYTTAPQEDGRTIIAKSELAASVISGGVSFSITYANAAEGMNVGSAARIERRHWLTGTMGAFWHTYSKVVLSAIFINLLAIASPIFTMNVYDRILPNKATSTLWVLAIGIGAVILFDLLLKTARASLIDYAGRKADLRISYLLFEKVLNSSLSARPGSTGEYANRVTQYEFVREFFTSNTISVFIDTAFVFVFLLVIYAIGGWLVVIPALAFVASVIVGLITQRRIGKRVAASMNEASQRQALLVESISTLETIKSLRAEAYLLRRWGEHSKNAANTSEKIKQLSAAAGNITQAIQQLVTVALVVAGAYAFSEGHISTGAIIGTVMLASRAVAPLGQIAITLSRLRQALLSLRIINSIMAQPEDRPDTVGFVNRPIRNGAMVFRNVGFVYPGSENEVLTGLNFSVKPGERIGIIGRIGSGKTTMGRLIGRLFLPTSGELLLDGIDIRQYHPSEVRAAVGIVAQAGDLFSGTIKENLLMACPEATDEEIIDAAKAAGVDEFVSRHPRGYDMNVGERGTNLSGGQRQTVAIARLLLTKPKIVFLDEPSGSMDLASERQLIKQLKVAFDENTTLIVSTHRYSMLELADRLIVVEQGRIVADGPKEQVVKALQKSG
ncbi:MULTISPECIES: type I secretion system permease/ATPase [unclassified Mesorhizobium]|uniref:type I secretion system permease/ATPase n=1 Tax=unclassified Mesorhizobium TaxID=325217 RepID=UPI000FD2C15F|nr:MULTISPECIES: type I secretion system permease/ATPase [unclassified Mesorhizobium]RVB75837.1 type I secretion system permease/ATPase [Mesorhizobium sp. M6A.T.Cr.TU.014.01.1.1]RWP79412.1 MAG: type I secretion system permease/ATPase [Mesorhizobium sp.]RWQ03398.1 MAG: type I secretion system permease/ATPase [Mesorhizobium sp.]RWQ04289.1 MAG: type I secretion system permease/ATPase [Mesorhizobium sp.]